jgi:hypothetical protein
VSCIAALSYRWGDAKLRRPISLNGRNFLVTENLEITLRHLRCVEGKRAVWIDALCINQDCIPERNEQVTKMPQIYQRAEKVVVWPGPASSNSDIAFQFLMEASLKRLENEAWLLRNLKTPSRSSHWKAIYDILERDY